MDLGISTRIASSRWRGGAGAERSEIIMLDEEAPIIMLPRVLIIIFDKMCWTAADEDGAVHHREATGDADDNELSDEYPEHASKIDLRESSCKIGRGQGSRR